MVRTQDGEGGLGLGARWLRGRRSQLSLRKSGPPPRPPPAGETVASQSPFHVTLNTKAKKIHEGSPPAPPPPLPTGRCSPRSSCRQSLLQIRPKVPIVKRKESGGGGARSQPRPSPQAPPSIPRRRHRTAATAIRSRSVAAAMSSCHTPGASPGFRVADVHLLQVRKLGLQIFVGVSRELGAVHV